MAAVPKLTRTVGDGLDRIEWLDEKGRTRAIRPSGARTAEEVVPGARVRRPGKFRGQRSYQGHYWCAGSGSMVFHESMMEFTAVMLLDHRFDVRGIAAQPMLITFEDGTWHYPDFLVTEIHASRLLVDVHPKSRTTKEDEHKHRLTGEMCERIGWRYLVIDDFTEVMQWNLAMLCRYHHPRFAPDKKTRSRIEDLVSAGPAFDDVRRALMTEKPGEHLPALFHMMWRREVLFDLAQRFTEWTRLCAA